MATRDVLLAAKTLIEQGWTQGVLARDANGYPVGAMYEGATQFCAVGALARATHKGVPFQRACAAQRCVSVALEARIGRVYPSISEYNGA